MALLILFATSAGVDGCSRMAFVSRPLSHIKSSILERLLEANTYKNKLQYYTDLENRFDRIEMA